MVDPEGKGWEQTRDYGVKGVKIGGPGRGSRKLSFEKAA